jgi:hypothetical protein
MFFASNAITVTIAQCQQILGLGRAKLVTEDRDMLRGDHARARIVGEPTELDQHPHDEELRREGRDCKVEALDAQTGQTEQYPHHRRTQAPENERDDKRYAVDAQHEIVGGKRPHRHERGRTERQLSGNSR